MTYSEKRIVSIHGNFLPSFAFKLFACKNVAFYTKQDFPRALSFQHHFICALSLLVFFLNRLTANQGVTISRAILQIEANAVIYTYKQTSQMRLASSTGNLGWSRTPPELVCGEA